MTVHLGDEEGKAQSNSQGYSLILGVLDKGQDSPRRRYGGLWGLELKHNVWTRSP